MGDVPVIEMSGVPPTMRQLAARWAVAQAEREAAESRGRAPSPPK